MIKALTFFLFSFVYLVSAQTSNPSYKTDIPNNVRFEVIQSSLAAKWTFRIDKFSGRVWQYVRTKDDDNIWEEMLVLPKPITSTRPKFQIYLSGLAAKFTFLIDNDSWKTWVLTTSKDKNGDELTYWNQLSE
jgi:hypothetical protein